MGFTAANSLTDRFTWLFDGLCRGIGVEARKQRLEAALAWAIWHRVRGLGDRLLALVARARSGRLPRRRGGGTPHPCFGPLHGPNPQGEREQDSPHPCPPPQEREREQDTPHPGPPPQGGRESAVAVAMPRGFGWARRMLPETGQYAGVLAYLLRDPETVALLAASPQAARTLRPLCHLLGVQAPAFLRRGGVVAQDAQAPVAAEIARGAAPHLTPAPRVEPGDDASAPRGGEGDEKAAQSSEATEETEAVPPAQPPPESGRSAEEEAALAYARRPGGLYWDGTRNRWS